MKNITFREDLNNQLKNPEFKKQWDELSNEYTLIQKIIDARIYRNMTQKDLAIKSGINQANISKIENAIYNPSLQMLNKIADLFLKNK